MSLTELHVVPPQGILDASGYLRNTPTGSHTTNGCLYAWAYGTQDADTSFRIYLNTGIIFGRWGLAHGTAHRLGELAQILAWHAVAIVNPSEITVIAELDADKAVVTALPRTAKRAHELVHPAMVASIRARSDTWGRRQLETGPALYAGLSLRRGQPNTSQEHHTMSNDEAEPARLRTLDSLPVRTPGRSLYPEHRPPRGTVSDGTPRQDERR
ncbi:hypothetical protein [Streptomyces sp. NPDC054863]